MSTRRAPTIRRMAYSLLAAGLVWVSLPQRSPAVESPQAESGKHFLWQVDSPTARVYLLGSIHLLRQDVYPLAPVIEEAFEQLLQLWQRGDAKAMEQQLRKDIEEEPRFEPIWKRLVDDRNLDMAERIGTFLASHQRYFVVVGVAHLIGARGLISLLRRRGYAVQQL